MSFTRYPAAAVEAAAVRLETPFFLYEEGRIRENCRELRKAFASRFRDFRPLFAAKANPNPEILRLVLDEGLGLDCSSAYEVWLARRLGATGMFTGNFVSPRSWEYILEEDDLVLNLDDLDALATILRNRRPELLSFRVNPGITGAALDANRLGSPEAKFGMPWRSAKKAFRAAADSGVERFGLHAMSGSNVFELDYFRAVTERLLGFAGELQSELGIAIELVNVGGGFPMRYHPNDPDVTLELIAAAVRDAFDEASGIGSDSEPALYVEPGRRVTGDAGWLVTTVTSVKRAHKTFVGVDASTADLPRPQIYGAYHHISVLGRAGDEPTETVDVVGSVCESTDRLATDRKLPVCRTGDVLVIHGCGAHAFAMSHNYNGRLRSAEYLAERGGNLRLIRRAERFEDLAATVPAPD